MRESVKSKNEFNKRDERDKIKRERLKTEREKGIKKRKY